jgi:hypothetical protein
LQANEPGVFYAAVIVTGVASLAALVLLIGMNIVVFRMLQKSSVPLVSRRRRQLQMATNLLSEARS